MSVPSCLRALPWCTQAGVEAPRVRRWNGTRALHRLVTETGDDSRLVEHHLARQFLEGWFMDQRAEVVLVGDLQGGVVLVKPGHRQLQGAAGIEAGGSWVGVHGPFGLSSGFENGGPFSLEEREVG